MTPAPRDTDSPPAAGDTAGPTPTVTLPGPGESSYAPAAGLPQRVGQYRILRLLGEGGMGAVYLGECSRLGRRAAVKVMRTDLAGRADSRARFERAARAADIEHDHIVPVWGLGDHAGSPYIAMPFLQGEGLDSRLRREPVPPLGVTLKAAREVAEGLAAAHARGLVHRDLKPANVWVEADPAAKDVAGQVRRFKVLDFGLARFTGGADLGLTASGAVMGTPAYMAPEQAAGKPADSRADLFSLGVMLYRMLTGELPFARDNVMAVLTALATVSPSARVRNPRLPAAVTGLVDMPTG